MLPSEPVLAAPRERNKADPSLDLERPQTSQRSRASRNRDRPRNRARRNCGVRYPEPSTVTDGAATPPNFTTDELVKPWPKMPTTVPTFPEVSKSPCRLSGIP